MILSTLCINSFALQNKPKNDSMKEGCCNLCMWKLRPRKVSNLPSITKAVCPRVNSSPILPGIISVLSLKFPCPWNPSFLVQLITPVINFAVSLLNSFEDQRDLCASEQTNGRSDWGSWGPERFLNVPQVTGLVSAWAETIPLSPVYDSGPSGNGTCTWTLGLQEERGTEEAGTKGERMVRHLHDKSTMELCNSLCQVNQQVKQNFFDTWVKLIVLFCLNN